MTSSELHLRTHLAERVLSAFPGGSSWPVVVQTRSGRFVTKLRGAAQGLVPLVSEIVGAELSSILGIPVPETALVDLPERIPSDDGRDELRDLLDRSAGLNLGSRYLEGARDATAADLTGIDDDLAARVLWLDGLLMNVDRTVSSPNVLVHRGAPWLIDFGASLTFAYSLARLSEDSPRDPEPGPARHVFARTLPQLSRVDAECAARLDRSALVAALARVPAGFLRDAVPGESPARARALYVAFLWKRLRPPRPFL